MITTMRAIEIIMEKDHAKRAELINALQEEDKKKLFDIALNLKEESAKIIKDRNDAKR